MKVLVTGASGFVGQHFINHVGAANVIAFPESLNLLEAEAVYSFVSGQHSGQKAGQKFDTVLHLAALSSVAQSLEDPVQTTNVNVEGTRNLLQALKDLGFSGRVLLVSTGEVYGAVDEKNLPVTETAQVAPRNPYAQSKVAMEKLVLPGGAFAGAGFTPLIARPFNHIGPGQAEHFAVASFTAQLARRKVDAGHGDKDLAGPMKTGDLRVTRDFTDVRDVVAAYMKLLTMRAPISIGVQPVEIYNLGSGVEVELQTILDHLIRISGTSTKFETDPSRLRPNEQRRMCADVTKIRAATNWTPQIKLETTLEDCFHAALEKLKTSERITT